MRPISKSAFLLAIYFGVCAEATVGHDMLVHQRITESAVDAARDLSAAYSAMLDLERVGSPIDNVD
jgi:hypothetical protein